MICPLKGSVIVLLSVVQGSADGADQRKKCGRLYFYVYVGTVLPESTCSSKLYNL